MRHTSITAGLIFIACLGGCRDTPQPPPELQETMAADNMRFPRSTDFVPDDEIIPGMRIELSNHYPVWRNEITANVHIVIRNMAQNYLAAQTQARLYVYDYNQKVPLYWANIDLAHARSVGPGTLSIISLPIQATKDLIVPIHDTTWENVDIKQWPDKLLYDIAPTGKYLMRLELELYNVEDKPVGTGLSNFIEFTVIRTAPEAIPN